MGVPLEIVGQVAGHSGIEAWMNRLPSLAAGCGWASCHGQGLVKPHGQLVPVTR